MGNQTFSLEKMLTRRGAITGATALGLSALTCFPAAAQNGTFNLSSKQSVPVSLNKLPDCSKERDIGLRAICNSVRRTEEAKARGAAADQVKVCLVELQAFKTKSPDKFAALGEITRDNACALAAKIRPTAGEPKPSG